MTKPASLQRAIQMTRRLQHGQATPPGGFTLVELMVVVAIVGILSAIALPGFLTAADKAKATEAKTMIAATLKQAHALFLENGEDPKNTEETMNETYGTPLNGDTKFNYSEDSFNETTNVWTITATGNSNDSGLNGKTLDGCVNFDTGIVDIQTQLNSSTAVSCSEEEEE